MSGQNSTKQWVTILGATGSIGQSTLDVIARNGGCYQVFALTANTQFEKLLEQCLTHRPVYAVMRDEDSAEHLRQGLKAQGSDTEVLSGEKALSQVAADSQVDAVMAAIVGAAGLPPTLAAVEAGKRVLLANKEALVMAGRLFMDAVKRHNAVLLPIDSEHNAIYQCMPADYGKGLANVGVKKILLTASGGPFRCTPLAELVDVSPEQACAHPNWSMGRKISVDSATMMNKGLELIEACWLFDAKPEQVEVIIHPQSIIHSMVEYSDGSVLAQLGNPDMRTPIAYGLAWPERINSGVSSLDLIATARLDFEAPDLQRFPCLRLASQAISVGGTAMVTLNAANEVAVESFLQGQLGFTQIAELVEEVLSEANNTEPHDLGVVKQADRDARIIAHDVIAQRTSKYLKSKNKKKT